MINILLVAFEFPPLNRGGVYRALRFAKYLRQFDINPIVITLDRRSYSKVYERFDVDETLLRELPSEIEMIEVPSPDIVHLLSGKLTNFFNTYFRIVEITTANWDKFFLTQIRELVKRFEPRCIFATVPPFGIAPLAVKVSKIFNLPLILDLRDAWSQWVNRPYGSWLHYYLTLRLERKCLNDSSAVVTTSDQTVEDLKKLHPFVNARKFHLITNGYDQEIKDWNISLANKDRFVIGYVGSFYYSPHARKQMFMSWWKKRWHRKFQYTPRKEDWLYRTPYFFFRAVKQLLDQRPDFKSRLSIKFAGSKPEWLDPMVDEFELRDHFQHLGLLNYADSIRFQQSCDALLITSSKVIGGEDYSIAGKTFEYIGAKKPIIGFVTEGAQKRLLERTGMSLICDPDRSEESCEKLKDFMEGNARFFPQVDFLNGLSCKSSTEKLARLIKDVCRK